MMRKLTSHLLLVMFLVGAASGFFVSVTGWWGLQQGSGHLKQLQIETAALPASPAVVEIIASAVADIDFALHTLLALSLLATIFFCVIAALTYRQSAAKQRQSVELEKRHMLFRILFEGTSEGVILMTAERLIDCNPAALRLLEVGEAEDLRVLLPESSIPMQHDQQALSFTGLRPRIRAAATAPGIQTFEWTFHALDGTPTFAELTLQSAAVGSETVIRLSIRDITSRKHAEASMRLANQVFDNSLEGIAITDAQGNIVKVNKAFSSITGYAAEEVIGDNPRLLSSGRHPASFYQEMWRVVNDTGKWQGEVWNRRKNGDIYPEWLSISRILDERGKLTNYVGVFSDISDVKLAEERLLRQTYYDTLTDLPNRSLFTMRLQQAVAAHGPESNSLALLLLDIDRFKVINDSIGHEQGDNLLRQVAHRLRRQLREADMIARMGGDEFAVLIHGAQDADHVASLARKLLDALREPFIVNAHELHVSGSIGITLYPNDAADAESLLRNVDVALYRGKALGGGRYEFFTHDQHGIALERLHMEIGLRGAVERNELKLVFQPQRRIVSGEIYGAEALVRWHEPKLGMVSPASFIPLAEESGLIVIIGEWILRQACAQAQRWLAAGVPLRVAVNVSPRQFHDGDLANLVAAVLQECRLPPHLLEIEITESILMQNAEQTLAILNRLHAMGVKIAIDDFGTGYSSLSYLKRLPIDVLKIDQSFVRDIADDADDRAIVSAIIGLAHSLQMDVIAEGVETEAQLAFLRERECGIMQGYLFSRPIGGDEVLKLVTAKTVAA
ncbi:putative bifunctional diguanylate cyclase/phosphodiesterase [Noviherbaspirillum aerium]|uniref:putative bifunctional diguanylate cyclase/phosphodiesterase n=1 Tax=Noviherbaspirillum aerium TaxID=2588497 RepID=UPI00124F3AA1|nr:EAL domain-containing protein [Noviherbaspirillum aerium]